MNDDTTKDPRLPGKDQSLWLATTPETGYPALSGPEEIDVAVLGGGITGLLTAYFLAKEGRSVAVVEARRIAADTTGHTTAKITSAHGMAYSRLSETFGSHGARVHAEANQQALEMYASLVAELSIECDFERMPAYVYAQSGKTAGALRQEAETAARLGLPASFTADTPLPFPVAGAVRYENQARFHPRKFLLALAGELERMEVRIFEDTKATGVRPGSVVEVDTDKGVVRAGKVLVATHFPAYDPAFFFARLFPMRSPVLACRLRGQTPMGLFIGAEEPFHSMRPQPVEGVELLVVNGNEYRAGHGGDTLELFRKLEGWVRSRFDTESVEYHWGAQDNHTPDMVPYIGRISKERANVFVATGYNGWGMTQSMAAAMLVSDLAMDRHHPWKDFYSPQRVTARSMANAVFGNVPVAKAFIGGLVRPAESFRPEELLPGEGGILDEKGTRKGVCRDLRGALHVVDPRCRHMGCPLVWNEGEHSWDCPCHGSRYDPSGKVIHGPAASDLRPMELLDPGRK